MVTDRTKMVSKMVNMTRISLKIIVSGKVRCINNISLRGEEGANGVEDGVMEKQINTKNANN